MSSRVSDVLGSAVLALACWMPVAALAQGTSTTQLDASGTVFVDRPEGCVWLSYGISQVSQTRPGPSSAQTFSSVQAWREGDGKDCAMVQAEGSSNAINFVTGLSDQMPEAFSADQRLMTGRLKTTIPITNLETGAEGLLVVDVVFNGVVGQLQPDRTHQTFPGSTSGPVMVHTRGYNRPATISGSVFDGTTDYASNASFNLGALSIHTHHTAGPKPRLLH